MGAEVRNLRVGPGRRRTLPPLTWAGMWVSGLGLVTLLAWIAGWAWLAAAAGLALFAVAAAAAGVDSRRPGDWTRVGGR
jgi:hypothetical protein